MKGDEGLEIWGIKSSKKKAKEARGEKLSTWGRKKTYQNPLRNFCNPIF